MVHAHEKITDGFRPDGPASSPCRVRRGRRGRGRAEPPGAVLRQRGGLRAGPHAHPCGGPGDAPEAHRPGGRGACGGVVPPLPGCGLGVQLHRLRLSERPDRRGVGRHVRHQPERHRPAVRVVFAPGAGLSGVRLRKRPDAPANQHPRRPAPGGGFYTGRPGGPVPGGAGRAGGGRLRDAGCPSGRGGAV